MPLSVDEWSDQYWDRVFARQSSQVDTVKLVVTFSLAISSTMVATALQVTPPQGKLDLAASVVLGAGFLLTIAVILMDRLKWPSRRKLLQKQTDNGWTDHQLLTYITSASRDAEEENETVVRRVKTLAESQLILAGPAGTLAVIWLIGDSGG
jgi:hypothetical protein